MGDFKTTSCICGFHIYQERWSPIIGKQLRCRCESTNPRDDYALAVCKGGQTVGQVPRYISTLCSLFIRHSAWSPVLQSFWSMAIFGVTWHFKDLLDENVKLEKFCGYQLIHENRETFPLQTNPIIQYSLVSFLVVCMQLQLHMQL